MLSALPVDLTLTTNASALPKKAQALKDAGLKRITVSLDSLDDAIFKAMNDVDFPVSRVLEGIEAAQAVGMPVKVNCVVKRGVNEHQIVELARHFRGTGVTLRFIEYMDVGATNGWRMDDVVPAAEIVAMLDKEFGVEPVDPLYRGEVAKRWQLQGRLRRDRRHRLGHPAVLRRLHPLAALGRGQALHLPVRRARPRPARADPQRRDRRGARATSCARSGASAATATPSCAPRTPSTLRSASARSRCRTSAASRGERPQRSSLRRSRRSSLRAGFLRLRPARGPART